MVDFPKRLAQATHTQGCASMLFESVCDPAEALITTLQHLLCQTHTACGHCGPCGWVAQGSHPDVHHLRPEGSSIGIDAIRGLTTFLHQKATSGSFAIIHQAHTLTTAASQALLKILEEPPEGAHLWLLAPHRFHVLPTLRSRCLIAAWPAAASGLATHAPQDIQGWLEGTPTQLWQHLKQWPDEQLPTLWTLVGELISSHTAPQQALIWWPLWHTHHTQAQAQGARPRWHLEACLHGMLATRQLS